jgi:drug/metabolite transporter (DMT)-like permease
VRNGYIFGFITVSLWAGFVLLSRTAEANGLNGFDLTALRFGTAALFLLPAWLFWHRVPLFNLARCWRSPPPVASVTRCAFTRRFTLHPLHTARCCLSGVLPFFVTLMAWLILGERPSQHRVMALVVIGAGVLCIGFYSMGNLRESWPGDVLLLTCSCLWGLYTVLVKLWRKSPWDITIGVALMSALIYLPVYWLFLPKGLLTAPWQAILLQAFFQGVLVVIVAMLCFMQAMARLGPTRLGAVMATVPAFAGIGAVVLLGEPFSWLLVAGLLLTCSGAWLGSRG